MQDTPDTSWKLCYVDGAWAWFTTAELKDQWGDDWNDAPYEHNAGRPYEWHEKRGVPPYRLLRVAYHGDLETPADKAGSNSRYSVQEINTGAVAWLVSSSWCDKSKITAIPAGTSLPHFITMIEATGGRVYLDNDGLRAMGLVEP